MNKFSIDLWSKARAVSGLQATPDGKHIAYTVSGVDVESNKNVSSIHVYNTETGESFRLASGGGGAFRDNDTYVFTKGAKDGTEFRAIDIRGGESYALFTVNEKISEFWPLGDGRFLMRGIKDYNRPEDKKTEHWEIYTEYPFKANAKNIVSGTRRTLFVYDGELKPITGPDFQSGEMLNNPTGVLITDKYVYHWGDPFTGYYHRTHELWRWDIETGENIRIAPAGDYLYVGGAELGGRIWLIGSVIRPDRDFFCHQLVSMLPDGSDMRLEQDLDYNYSSMKVWNNEFWFVNNVRAKTRICRWAPGMAECEEVFNGHMTSDTILPAAGKLYFTGRTENTLHELYVLEGGNARRITDESGFFRDVELSVPHEVTFTDPDGFPIQGWVLPPHNYEPGKKYPGILFIHGGPQGVYDPCLNIEMQYHASRGYFVFFSNPRGSSSYGKPHLWIFGQYGTYDYMDLMLFTDECLKAWPDIDAGRLGVTGGSYGGYMSNWIIGHTDRFKAAVPVVSISNWFSKYLVGDLAWYVDWSMMSSPWESPDKLWWHSPLKYADKCVTPTLFIQNEYDYRCPIEQAEQMFTALCMRGVPARMIVNYKAHHGGMNPVQKKHAWEETAAWFDKYCV